MDFDVKNSTPVTGTSSGDYFSFSRQGTRSSLDTANSNDTYEVFMPDGPAVTIEDHGGNDELTLASVRTFIDPHSVVFTRQGDDLGLSVRGFTGTVVIKDYYGNGRIETILAGYDGSTLVSVPDLLPVTSFPHLPIKTRSFGVEGAETTSARQLVQAMAGFAAPAAGHSAAALAAAKPQFDLAAASL